MLVNHKKKPGPIRINCQDFQLLHGSDWNPKVMWHWLKHLSGKCGGLPAEISKLKTTAKFPVNHGEQVTVSCEYSIGIELRGDSVITCIEGSEYRYQVKPKCNQVGMSTWELFVGFYTKFFFIVKLVNSINTTTKVASLKLLDLIFFFQNCKIIWK